MSKVNIERLTAEKIQSLGVESWPIWEKEISRFDWTYSESEQCYIVEGEVVVETEEGHFDLVAGDYVTFQKGLTCIWDIKKNVKKHYNF